MCEHGIHVVLSIRLARARFCAIRHTVTRGSRTLLLAVMVSCAIIPASALAMTAPDSGGGMPVITQSAEKACFAIPSDTIRLRSPVAAGDDLVLLVSGQGYDSAAPVVTGVADPLNGTWSPLVNDKSLTLDRLRYLSYAVYDVTNAKAAPNGLTVTVTQQRGQSAAGAVLLDVGGPVSEDKPQFQQALQKTSQNTLYSPAATGTSGELAVGLFGAYNMQQSFSPGSGWTLASTATSCTRALAESEPLANTGSVTAVTGVSSWTDYLGGLITFAAGSTAAQPSQPPAPVNTAAPAISGTAQQGQTLTASAGSWSNNPSSYAYQWQDCSSSSSCSNISGATSSSYVLQSSDVGKTIDVVVTATNASGSASGTSGQTGTVQADPPPAPVNTAAPAISGTAQQGQTLTASAGSWSNNPSSYAYQWQDCSSSSSCSNISGATSSSYVLQSSDVGKTIDVVVTATNASGSASGTSGQTGTVQADPPPAPVNTAAPAISGTAQQGQTLTASAGSWSNNPSSYAYQWQDCSSSSSCSNISGATSSSYVLQSSDVGKTIDVVVTATNASGSASGTSGQTAVVTGTGTGTGGGGHQMFANYLAWATNLGSNLPWNDLTQVVMFALKTTNGTALDASTNEVNHYDLPNWTAMIHSHDIAGTTTPEQAIIAIGGSNDSDWQYACDSTNQAGFVSNLISYAVNNGFDGIDIDAEAGTGSAAQFESCVQAIATAGHAATTAEGKPLIIAEEMDESLYNSLPYSTIQTDISYLDQVQLEYFGYNPYSDWNCGTGSPANTCAYVSQMVSHATSQGIPADKLLLGMATYSPYAQGSYSTLAPTTSAVNTTSGTPSSIPVSSISSAISAGDIVLASTENPPAHYEVFTTSGAAACSSNCSIPITGEVYGNGSYAFPSGSDVQSAYAGPWDCYNMGQYAATHGLKGNMIFDLQDDESGHSGSFACSDQLGLGLGT